MIRRALAVAAFVAPLVAPLGCGPRPASEAAMLLAPGTPRPEGCAPIGATRCVGAVPEACGESGRWWPAEACPGGCVLEDAGARCLAVRP